MADGIVVESNYFACEAQEMWMECSPHHFARRALVHYDEQVMFAAGLRSIGRAHHKGSIGRNIGDALRTEPFAASVWIAVVEPDGGRVRGTEPARRVA